MADRAKESDQVKRARRKLERQIEEEHERITPNALNAASQKILNRIQRTARDRHSLKEKNVGLFDQNRHSATVSSQFVERLRAEIATEMAQPIELGRTSLRGRISGMERRESPYPSEEPNK